MDSTENVTLGSHEVIFSPNEQPLCKYGCGANYPFPAGSCPNHVVTGENSLHNLYCYHLFYICHNRLYNSTYINCK